MEYYYPNRQFRDDFHLLIQICSGQEDTSKCWRILCGVGVNGLTLPMLRLTFIRSTRMLRFLKNIQTLSCWYSLESSR